MRPDERASPIRTPGARSRGGRATKAGSPHRRARRRRPHPRPRSRPRTDRPRLADRGRAGADRNVPPGLSSSPPPETRSDPGGRRGSYVVDRIDPAPDQPATDEQGEGRLNGTRNGRGEPAGGEGLAELAQVGFGGQLRLAALRRLVRARPVPRCRVSGGCGELALRQPDQVALDPGMESGAEAGGTRRRARHGASQFRGVARGSAPSRSTAEADRLAGKSTAERQRRSSAGGSASSRSMSASQPATISSASSSRGSTVSSAGTAAAARPGTAGPPPRPTRAARGAPDPAEPARGSASAEAVSGFAGPGSGRSRPARPAARPPRGSPADRSTASAD